MRKSYKVLCCWGAGLLLGVFIINGCNSVVYSRKQEARYFKPTIAVMSFENRAPVQTRWQLGDALADQLIDRLMRTHRYVVLERGQLNAIMRELRRVGNPAFRKTGQPQLGRLKHVKYLIKGTITDFGHVETVEGMARLLDWGWLGSSSYALVAATIYVVDVESGQVIASASVESKIRDSRSKEKVNYNGMSFGGYTFYHTSLGRATNKMLDKAVRMIAKAIAEDPYQPKISTIINGRVVINGGRNRLIKVGDEFEVRPPAEKIVDPDTGDVLGHVTSSAVGRIRVVQTTSKFAIAEIIRGNNFAPGQTLFKVDPKIVGNKIAVSSY